MNNTFLTVFVSAVLGGIIGSGVTYYLYEERVTYLEQNIDVMPKIAIADFARIALKNSSRSEEEMDSLINEYNLNIAKLNAAGFIVLNGQGVTLAPEDFYIPDPGEMPPVEQEQTPKDK